MKEQRTKAEHEEDVALWRNTISKRCGGDLKSYPYAVLQSTSKKATKLTDQRRILHHKTLMDLVVEVIATPEEETNSEEECVKDEEQTDNLKVALPHELQACSVCRGGCCTAGADHAYIRAETIRRYLSVYPDQNPERIVAAYTTYLPDVALEGSCIYHTEDGCALPRNLRSDVCNCYLCKSLKSLRQQSSYVREPKGVFYIRRARSDASNDILDPDNRIVSSQLVLNDF